MCLQQFPELIFELFRSVMLRLVGNVLVDPCSCRCRGTFSFRVRDPGVFASLGTPGYPP
jgi:hypothetical protein